LYTYFGTLTVIICENALKANPAKPVEPIDRENRNHHGKNEYQETNNCCPKILLFIPFLSLEIHHFIENIYWSLITAGHFIVGRN
jgi:hypothetical protein